MSGGESALSRRRFFARAEVAVCKGAKSLPSIQIEEYGDDVGGRKEIWNQARVSIPREFSVKGEQLTRNAQLVLVARNEAH